MKIKAIVLIVSVCFMFCLTSCTENIPGKYDNSENPETAEHTYSGTEPETDPVRVTEQTSEAPEAFGKFTFAELCNRNKVSVLLENYKTVSAASVDSEGRLTREEYYFSYEGYPVNTSHWLPNNGDEEFYYNFNGNSVVKEDGKYVMNYYSGPEQELEIYYDPDNDIIMKFDLGPDLIYDLKENESTYSFKIGYKENDSQPIVCEVSKYNLSVRKVILNPGTDGEFITEYKYDGDIKDFGFTKGWKEHKLKEVTVISEIEYEGNIADGFETVIAPFNVNVKPFSYYGCKVTNDSERTKEYKYPGDGEDYTVYYTNITDN